MINFIERREALKIQFEEVKQLPHYRDLLKKYFELPTRLAKMNPSVQEKILRENFKFLERIVIPLGDECWPMLRNLFGLIETLKPDALIELSKLAISERLDSVSGALSKETVENELILIIDRNFLAVSPHTTTKVKLNTLKVFSRVLERLEPLQREKYADLYYSALQNHKLRWRFRLMIVSQFEILVNLFSLEKLNAFFLPMLVGFCRDECYAVRRSATATFWLLYNTLHSGDLEVAKMVVDINLLSFSDYQRFSFRQSFIYMVEGILLNCPNYLHLEAPAKLVDLSRDGVINVRLSLAKMLRTLRAETRFDCSVDWFRTCFENLLAYEDKDVSDILADLEDTTPKVSVASQSQQSVSENSEGSALQRGSEKMRKKVVKCKAPVKLGEVKGVVKDEVEESKDVEKVTENVAEKILDGTLEGKVEAEEKNEIEIEIEEKEKEVDIEIDEKLYANTESKGLLATEDDEMESEALSPEVEREPFTVISTDKEKELPLKSNLEELYVKETKAEERHDAFEKIEESEGTGEGSSNSTGSEEFKAVGEENKKDEMLVEGEGGFEEIGVEKEGVEEGSESSELKTDQSANFI